MGEWTLVEKIIHTSGSHINLLHQRKNLRWPIYHVCDSFGFTHIQLLSTGKETRSGKKDTIQPNQPVNDVNYR